MTEISPGVFTGLTRLADENGRFKMLAVDQRPPIENLVRDGRRAETADFEDVVAIKRQLLESLSPHSSAVLIDPQYLFPSSLDLVRRDTGLLITLEYDRFEETSGGRRSSPIPDWSVSKIRMGGGDAVKVLAWYRPDAEPAIREHQEAFVESVAKETSKHDIPFVFELLVYPLPGDDGHTTDYVEHPAKRSDHVIESVETFAHSRFGVDLFKLESPVSAASIPPGETPDELVDSFKALDNAAGRPWVVLSAGADQQTFRTIAGVAFESGASGYLAGRAIWWDACVANFPDLEAMQRELDASSAGYMAELNDLTDRLATPWAKHRCWENGPSLSPAGDTFRRQYGSAAQ